VEGEGLAAAVVVVRARGGEEGGGAGGATLDGRLATRGGSWHGQGA